MNKTLKGFALIPLVLLTFTGCFGGDDEETPTNGELQNFTTFQTANFSISKPQDWKVIEAKDFSQDVPSETQIIFRDNILNDRFTPNSNVTKRMLNYPMSSFEFGKTQIDETKSTLLNFKEVSRDEEFNIVIGGQLQKTMLILFEGKQTESQPTLRIMQTFAVNGTDAYTTTAAYLKDADDITVENAKSIVKSFKVL
jgi:hypothetical protein